MVSSQDLFPPFQWLLLRCLLYCIVLFFLGEACPTVTPVEAMLAPLNPVIYGIFATSTNNHTDQQRLLKNSAQWMITRINNLQSSHVKIDLEQFSVTGKSASTAEDLMLKAFVNSTQRQLSGITSTIGVITSGVSIEQLHSSQRLWSMHTPSVPVLSIDQTLITSPNSRQLLAVSSALVGVCNALGWNQLVVVCDRQHQQLADAVVEELVNIGVCVEDWILLTDRTSQDADRLHRLQDTHVLALMDVRQHRESLPARSEWLFLTDSVSSARWIPSYSMISLPSTTDLQRKIIERWAPTTGVDDLLKRELDSLHASMTCTNCRLPSAFNRDIMCMLTSIYELADRYLEEQRKSVAENNENIENRLRSQSKPPVEFASADNQFLADMHSLASSKYSANMTLFHVLHESDGSLSLQLRAWKLLNYRDSSPNNQTSQDYRHFRTSTLSPSHENPISSSDMRQKRSGRRHSSIGCSFWSVASLKRLVVWQPDVITVVMATLSVCALASCLFFVTFYALVSCGCCRLSGCCLLALWWPETGSSQCWIAWQLAWTAVQLLATLPFYLRPTPLVCEMRVQAPALGSVGHLAAMVSRSLSLIAASRLASEGGQTSRNTSGTGWLQWLVWIFLVMAQVAVSTERWLLMSVTSSDNRHQDTLRVLRQLVATTSNSESTETCPVEWFQQVTALVYTSVLHAITILLSPWMAVTTRSFYREASLSALHSIFTTALWTGCLVLYSQPKLLGDIVPADVVMCVYMVSAAVSSLLVMHLPRMLIMTHRAGASCDGDMTRLPFLHGYRRRLSRGDSITECGSGSNGYSVGLRLPENTARRRTAVELLQGKPATPPPPIRTVAKQDASSLTQRQRALSDDVSTCSMLATLRRLRVDVNESCMSAQLQSDIKNEQKRCGDGVAVDRSSFANPAFLPDDSQSESGANSCSMSSEERY